MRVATLKVFDNIINGTTPVYTSAEFDRAIGNCDLFALHAFVTGVSGTAPTMTVASELSADDQNWIATGFTEINVSALQSNTSYQGYNYGDAPNFAQFGPFLRFKITLGGTSPKCQLKLYATCRSVAR